MNILAVGDIHEPCSLPGYLDFCVDMYKAWRCNGVVMIGDVGDLHGISRYVRETCAPGIEEEYELAREKIQLWYKAFPNAKVCIGNHDLRLVKLAKSVGIPQKFLKEFSEIWGTPKWDWAYEHIADDVYYYHGEGSSGLHPAYNVARQIGMSTVVGHTHSAGGIKWIVGPQREWFGMDTGCGVDDKEYAFAYAKNVKKKSVIGCGIILDGNPYYEKMQK